MSGRPGYKVNRAPKYPWPDLGRQRVMDAAQAPRIRAAACMYAKSHGMQFTTETVESYLIVKRVK